MKLNIEGQIISNTSPTYVIAEIGNNHNGDFERAKKMVYLAKEMGANCAKFQMRDLSKVYRKKSLEKSGDDLSAEYTMDLLKRFELTAEQQLKLMHLCRELGITYLCTPWDSGSLQTLEKMGVAAYKVASADLTNFPLLEELVATKKPLILSSGMSNEEEIQATVKFLNDRKAQFVMLHCNSTYPAPFHAINLNYIRRLKEIHPLIGYSGHERGTAVSLGAVALGAKVIERHFTLDRNMEGPDHAASLETADFAAMIAGIRQLDQALGDGKKVVSQGEMINRENLAKSLISSRPLKKGHILTRDDIDIKSPGQGLSPRFLEQLIGTKLERDMSAEEFFFKTDLTGGHLEKRQYKFSRPWGIPVRYHDYAAFATDLNADLYEFHLSYADMDLKLEDYFKGPQKTDFVVHAPELFKDSQLMDLATPDEGLRQFSLRETQRVINITRELKKYFPKTKKPLIVANIGGFSRDANITETQKEECYRIFAKSLKELDMEGVELIPQTMAPFPWHFGGQRFQNIFVHADEIVAKCKELGLRMCLDVSHSLLTCNNFNTDFYEFLEKVGPYTAHLHLGDAKGIDGEGLQVGDGEIDFPRMGKILAQTCPTASFIPEIWQGHKNRGEGFWVALERLENIV
jgi:sialic acid synthase SpsE/sugar phosphate isomerase/epimerase